MYVVVVQKFTFAISSLDEFLHFFVQGSNTRVRLRVQMLYDDVVNEQDYVGLKRLTEDRELR